MVQQYANSPSACSTGNGTYSLCPVESSAVPTIPVTAPPTLLQPKQKRWRCLSHTSNQRHTQTSDTRGLRHTMSEAALRLWPDCGFVCYNSVLGLANFAGSLVWVALTVTLTLKLQSVPYLHIHASLSLFLRRYLSRALCFVPRTPLMCDIIPVIFHVAVKHGPLRDSFRSRTAHHFAPGMYLFSFLRDFECLSPLQSTPPCPRVSLVLVSSHRILYCFQAETWRSSCRTCSSGVPTSIRTRLPRGSLIPRPLRTTACWPSGAG